MKIEYRDPEFPTGMEPETLEEKKNYSEKDFIRILNTPIEKLTSQEQKLKEKIMSEIKKKKEEKSEEEKEK